MRLAPISRAWIGPLIVFIVELPAIWTSPHVGEWFFFWYAGHLTAAGTSPYDPASWLRAATEYGPAAHGVAVNTLDGLSVDAIRSDYRWIWPPLAGLLLAPFGALPLEVGIPLLHLATIATAVLGTFALVRTLVPPAARTFGLALLLATPSLVQTMRASTLTVVILPGVVLVFVALARPGAARLSLGALALSTRTALFVASVPATIAVMVRSQGWRRVAIAAASWVAINAVAFAASPVPFDPTLVDSARAFTLHDNSSTWRLAWEIAPEHVLAVVLVMLAIAGSLAVVAVRRAPPRSRDAAVLACGLALGVAVVPYAHTYDQLALFPAWLLVLRAAAEGSALRRTLTGAAVVVVALGYGWCAYFVGAAGTRAAIAVTPYLALALLALVAGPTVLASKRTVAMVAAR